LAGPDDSDTWTPDPALVLSVRSRTVPIARLAAPDRAWVVAALTLDGWTVRAIADRLKCSLRLIQQIKAEPMTHMAVFAMSTERALLEERNLRRLEGRLAAHETAALQDRVTALTEQRDRLIGQMARRQREVSRGAPTA
jgi:hypothetical protein